MSKSEHPTVVDVVVAPIITVVDVVVEPMVETVDVIVAVEKIRIVDA